MWQVARPPATTAAKRNYEGWQGFFHHRSYICQNAQKCLSVWMNEWNECAKMSVCLSIHSLFRIMREKSGAAKLLHTYTHTYVIASNKTRTQPPEQNKLLHCCAMLINYLNASITMDGKSSIYPELQKFPLPWVAEVSITMEFEIGTFAWIWGALAGMRGMSCRSVCLSVRWSLFLNMSGWSSFIALHCTVL